MFVEGKSTEYADIRELIPLDSMVVSYSRTGDGQPLKDVVWWNADQSVAKQLERPLAIKFEPSDDEESGSITVVETNLEEPDHFYHTVRPPTLDEMTAFALRLKKEEDPRAQVAVEFVQEKIKKSAIDLGLLTVEAAKEPEPIPDITLCGRVFYYDDQNDGEIDGAENL